MTAKASPNRVLLPGAIGFYLLFIVLTYAGAGRWGFWFAVAWPYSFLLALQKFIGGPGEAGFVFAWVLGFVAVAMFARQLQRVSIFARRPALALGASAVAWYVPLGILTIVALGIARLFGWPYGE
ncbi:MAG TPA: hypothetical protein VFS34_05680 [Thermoanaerobaculia bacterium]|nr:hypothetical protein [Thermoanaerobaculia bacterium]